MCAEFGFEADFPYPIKAVILDYGDVISLPADPDVMSWMASIFQVPLQRFRDTYGQFRHDYDKGTLDAAGYWNKIGEANGVNLTDEQIGELRKADVKMWARLNPRVLRWNDELRKAGFKTAVLSNMHADMVKHIRAQSEWEKRFDVLALSSALGMAKPDSDIFEYILRELKLQPSEAMFVDDRESNVDAAVRLGIMGVHAPTTEALVDLLGVMGFSPLPDS